MSIEGMSHEKPVRQREYVGQTSAIRKINPHDPEDMRRVDVIDKDRNVLLWMEGEPQSLEELHEFVADNAENVLYAVSGREGTVLASEIGQIQGWIFTYSEKAVLERVERGLNRKITEDEPPPIEISFARYPSAPNRQIASGLRQVCLGIAQSEVLQSSERKNKPQRLVVAFVDPDNVDSINVLKAAGFVRRRNKVAWDSAEPDSKDYLYTLDWKKLNEIVHTSGDRAIEELVGKKL